MTGSSIALETVVDYLNVALERHLARLEAGCMEFLLENFDLVRVTPAEHAHRTCNTCKCPLPTAHCHRKVDPWRRSHTNTR